MIIFFKYIWIYLCRIPNVRGFGIQSPSAFYFATEVINQRKPYYKYKELANAIGNCNFIERKLLKLYLRIANYVRPANIVIVHSDSPDDGRLTNAAKQYMHAGCTTASLASVEQAWDDKGLAFAILDKTSYPKIADAISRMSEGSCIILQDIYKDDETLALWKELLRLDKSIISFDLYYAGLIFYNPKHTQGNYKVNF